MLSHVVLWLAMPLLVSTATVDWTRPVSAGVWAQKAGQGFTTNYFKTETPLARYHTFNPVHVAQAGFSNLRLEIDASMHSPDDDVKFKKFLDDLERVVDDCLRAGVFPIISWLHGDAEIHPNERYRRQYIKWWEGVARRLRFKDYRLTFNLFTELGFIGCQPEFQKCPNSIRENIDTYHKWTKPVVKAIRKLPGRNKNRMLILASPKKFGWGLKLIDPAIYQNDNNMMAEYHSHESGPTNKPNGPRNWSGCGSKEDKKRVKDAIAAGTDWAKTNIPVYIGEWMANDNNGGTLNQTEAECFGCYFAKILKRKGVPWSMNDLDLYYDTKRMKGIKRVQTIPRKNGAKLKTLDIVREVRRCM